MDGNDKDAVSGIHHISTALLQGYDFVQGSRFISGGIAENTPISRYLAIRLLHAPITSIAAGKYFTDTTNGFRGIRTSALMDDRISYNREIFLTYELIAYLPIRFSKLGFKCIEVPVSRIYPKNQKIPTKILGFRGPISLLGILLKAAWGKYDPITKANHRQKI
jgi:hypothetical protein